MAYMNQERKAQLAPAIKAVLAKYDVKASLAVRHHSTLVINIKQGKLDFIENCNRVGSERMQQQGALRREIKDYMDINPYWFHEHFDGSCKNFLTELYAAAKGNIWYDRSDAQVDYFDTAYYIDVNVGSWNKPYALVK